MSSKVVPEDGSRRGSVKSSTRPSKKRKKAKKKKKKSSEAHDNRSKREMVLALENASSESSDSDDYAAAEVEDDKEYHEASDSESGEELTELNKKNEEILKNEVFEEDIGETWKYKVLCCCNIRNTSSAQAFFCAPCMYGRALNVALEHPFVLSCLCCYLCQPCRRKEIRVKYNINGSDCDDVCCCLWCPCAVGPQVIAEVIEHETCDISMCGTIREPPDTEMSR